MTWYVLFPHIETTRADATWKFYGLYSSFLYRSPCLPGNKLLVCRHQVLLSGCSDQTDRMPHFVSPSTPHFCVCDRTTSCPRNWLCTRLPVFPINCCCTVVSQGCAYQRSSPVTFFLLFTVTIKGKVVCGMSVCNMSSQIGLAYSAAPRTLVRAGTEGPPE